MALVALIEHAVQYEIEYFAATHDIIVVAVVPFTTVINPADPDVLEMSQRIPIHHVPHRFEPETMVQIDEMVS